MNVPKPAVAVDQQSAKVFFKFANACVAGCAAVSCTHPFDVVKVRLQIAGEGGAGGKTGVLSAVRGLIQEGGPKQLYAGLSAALLRQVFYGSSRLGLFSVSTDFFQERNNGKSLPFYMKTGLALGSGGFAAVIGTPFDLALVRMASDGKLPVEQQKQYKSAFDAVARVARSEGITGLWTGCTPTVIRACFFNMGQLATYAQFKEHLVDRGLPDQASTHLVAAFGSGLCATIISLPFDIAKTRLQKTVVTEAGAKPAPLYAGMFDCIAKTAKAEGPLALWKGFTPSFIRTGPYITLTMVFLEQANALTKKYVLGK
jgi:solute carrier family 25 oxoglutarate transporter 11